MAADGGVIFEPHLDVCGVRRDCHFVRLRLKADYGAAFGHAYFLHHAPDKTLPGGVEDHPALHVPDLRAVRTLLALRQPCGFELDYERSAWPDLAGLALLPADEELNRNARPLLMARRRGRGGDCCCGAAAVVYEGALHVGVSMRLNLASWPGAVVKLDRGPQT